MAIYSFATFGFEGSLVTVEVDLRRGIPAMDIIGLADNCVKEARERVRSAFNRSGIEFPSERVLISLSPADLRKDSTAFDLPLAMGIYGALHPTNENIFAMGELALNGEVRNVRGVYAALQSVAGYGIKYAIIPHSANLEIPKGIKVATVGSLTEAVAVYNSILNGDYSNFHENTKEKSEMKVEFVDKTLFDDMSLDNITRLNGLKYAMTVAVAGKHNLLAYGAPGCGKTLILQKMPEIMPTLSEEEFTTVKRIYSLAGYDEGAYFVDKGMRPFRMPHQTASIEGICGGGVTCRPGEISLAHRGVLFLDEAAEFRASVLQMLRVPLETKQITLARAGRSTSYPADFQLVMAANPCPCGNYGNPKKICLCSIKSVEQYWKKFSSSLLERIEIRYNCDQTDDYADISVDEMRELIKRAWERQFARQGKLNNELTADEIKKFIPLSDAANEYISKAVEKYGLSYRGLNSILKLARTLSDMYNPNPEEPVTIDDITRALKLRVSTPLEML